MSTVDLSPDEANFALGALYERLTETKRYIASTRQIIKSHEGHEECCARGFVERETVGLGELERRLAAIQGAIVKIEAVTEEPS